jgi:polyisoprenoid-binding protein YceI
MLNKVRWALDMRHSEIGFKIRHLKIAHVSGRFDTIDANILTTGNDFDGAKIHVVIEASSINTGDKKRDEHLRGADFFDVKNFNQIIFKSTSLEIREGKKNHELWGELTIKDITKMIVLNVQSGGLMNDPWGNERAGFRITGKIKRSDFGLGWNTATGMDSIMLGENVKILCEAEVLHSVKTAVVLKPELVDGQQPVY